MLYVAMVTAAFVVAALIGISQRGALLAAIAFPVAFAPMRTVLSGARGPQLVPALAGTGLVLLAYGLLLGLGLALSD